MDEEIVKGGVDVEVSKDDLHLFGDPKKRWGRRAYQIAAQVCRKLAAARHAKGTYPWAEALAKANPKVSVRRRGWGNKDWRARIGEGGWFGRDGDRHWRPWAVPAYEKTRTDWEIYEEDSGKLQVTSDECAEVEVPVEWRDGGLQFRHPYDTSQWFDITWAHALSGWRYVGAKHRLPDGTWSPLCRTVGLWVDPHQKATSSWSDTQTAFSRKLVDGKDRAPDGGPTVKLVFEWKE